MVGESTSFLDAVRSLDVSTVRHLLEYGQTHSWFAVLMYFFAQYLLPLMFVVLVLLWFEKTRSAKEGMGNKKTVILSLLTVVFALAIKSAVSFIFYRPRPFITHPDLLSLTVRVDPGSFPSAHSLLAFALAGSLLFSKKYWIGAPLLVMAVFVAVGRVGIGVHYPTDVLAGAILGLGIAWLAHSESSSLKKYLPES